MLDCNTIIKKVDTLISNYLNGRQTTVTDYKEIDNLLTHYFIEFRQKYPDELIERHSYLARYLDEHRFYNYPNGRYGTPSEFLQEIQYSLGLD